MADKQLGDDFDVSSGRREFEIFMLPEKARKALQVMRDKAEKETEHLQEQQKAHHEQDVLSAKREIAAERPAPQLTPFMARRRKQLNEHQVETLAEQLVEARNEKQIGDLKHVHLQREDDFLAKQKEERLCRQAMELNAGCERQLNVELKHDIDRSR